MLTGILRDPLWVGVGLAVMFVAAVVTAVMRGARDSRRPIPLATAMLARQSTLGLARSSIHTAMLPSIDQTRTTGIVVLPGALVGAIFAGVSQLEAGRFQIVVLASILAVGVMTAVILTRLTGAIASKPSEA